MLKRYRYYLLYMIEQKFTASNLEKNRTPLNVEEDLMGITMVIPGIRGKHGTITKVKIRQMNDEQEGEAIMQIEIALHMIKWRKVEVHILRLIQNNDTTKLDLLVRESLQNCLDAGNKASKFVNVDFITGSTETDKVRHFFADIENNLKENAEIHVTLLLLEIPIQ